MLDSKLKNCPEKQQRKRRIYSGRKLSTLSSSVADPGGLAPDPDPTVNKEKRGPNPGLEKHPGYDLRGKPNPDSTVKKKLDLDPTLVNRFRSGTLPIYCYTVVPFVIFALAQILALEEAKGCAGEHEQQPPGRHCRVTQTTARSITGSYLLSFIFW